MSLLADLLSKVKYDKQERREGGIPPTLQRVVFASKEKKSVGKPFIVAGSLALAMVVAGLAIVYYMSGVTEPASKVTAARRDLRRPPAQDVAREQVGAPQPSVQRPPHETKVESVVRTERDMPVVPQPAGGAKTRPDNRDLSKPQGMSGREDATSLEQHKTNLAGTMKTSSTGIARSGSDGAAPGYPKDLTEQSRAKRDEFLYAARDYETDKNYDRALQYYRKVLELDPRNYMVMNNISGIMISLSLYDEAIKYSRDALGIRKDYVPSLVNLGISLAQSGKMAEGRDYLLKARSLDASNRNASLNLALLYEKIADYGEAQKLYLMLCETEDVQGCFGAARVTESMGERDEARKTYRKILALGNADSKAKKLASERLSFLESR
jgi:tetratricopeptide (TPR) repeat protein